MANAYTPISSVGEFGLIERITRGFPRANDFVTLGVGDDAAVVSVGEGKSQVMSSDLLLEGVHFDLSYMPLQHLGYKAVAVNLSDIAAMNAIPYGIIVNIAMSSRFPVEAVEELYAGIKKACERYKVDLLGGDTSSSKQGLMISITAVGGVEDDKTAYRSGAKPKDLICVSGDLGGAYAGYLVLDREKSVFLDKPDQQPDLNDYNYVVERQLRPEPRLDIIQLFYELGIVPNSMIDVSDGIASEIHHICSQSNLGAKIFTAKLPIDFQTVSVAEEFKIGPTTFALNGGEDYELLFTLPLSDFDKIKSRPEITIIGNTTEEKEIHAILDDGSVVDIHAQGWEHFQK